MELFCDNKTNIFKYILVTRLKWSHVREFGFRNPGNVCLWNPESGQILLSEYKKKNRSPGFWNGEYRSRNPESKLYWQIQESSTCNPRQKSWNSCLRFPFPKVDLGITVVSLLQNMRGSTLGRERAHYSENKSVRSKSQEFSRKFKRSGVCFNDLWRVLWNPEFKTVVNFLTWRE